MGNSNSLKLSLQPEEITAIEDDKGVTLGQISGMHSWFSKLDQENKGYLEREDLLAVPELAINPLGDRIVHTFFYQSKSGLEDEKLDVKVCSEALKENIKLYIGILSELWPTFSQSAKMMLETS